MPSGVVLFGARSLFFYVDEKVTVTAIAYVILGLGGSRAYRYRTRHVDMLESLTS